MMETTYFIPFSKIIIFSRTDFGSNKSSWNNSKAGIWTMIKHKSYINYNKVHFKFRTTQTTKCVARFSIPIRAIRVRRARISGSCRNNMACINYFKLKTHLKCHNFHYYRERSEWVLTASRTLNDLRRTINKQNHISATYIFYIFKSILKYTVLSRNAFVLNATERETPFLYFLQEGFSKFQ